MSGDREVDGLVHTVDLFATALDLASVDRSAVLPNDVLFDSVRLAPYLDNSALGSLRATVITEVFGGKEVPGKAIRDAQYKLIRFDSGQEELYALASDPFETNNLLSAVPPSADAVAHRDSLDTSLSELLATQP